MTTNAATTTSRPQLWVPGDWNALFGFGTNILVNLLTLTGLPRVGLGFSDELVFGRILPAVGLMLFLSTGYYAWLAYDLARRTGRRDVCALPSGPGVGHMFIVVFAVMLPIKLRTGDPIRAWEAGLTWVGNNSHRQGESGSIWHRPGGHAVAVRRLLQRVRRAVHLGRLEAMGGIRSAVDFTPFREAAVWLYAGPWVAERLAGIGGFLASEPPDVHPMVGAIINGGAAYSAVDAYRAAARLEALKRHVSREWASIDVLLVPTAGTIYTKEVVDADPIRLNTNLGYYTNFVNLLDMAAIAVPAGFRPDGLPFGVSLVGPPSRMPRSSRSASEDQTLISQCREDG